MERELTIDGLKVIAHKWIHDVERTFDYTEHVEQVKILLELQQAKQKPLLVVVYGVSGCGKTMLARVLAESGNNAKYLDCLAVSPLERGNDFSYMLSDVKTTYLLDEPGILNSSIWMSVDNHVANGGICICFVQDEQDWQGQSECKYLNLMRNGFTWH